MRPLLFFTFINDLPAKLQSLVKLLVDDTSLFSTIYDPLQSEKLLNDDLIYISDWAYKWRFLFNPDISKQAQEVIAFRKNTKIDCQAVYFNEAPVSHTPCQKHLGMHLHETRNFYYYVKKKPKVNKANKGIVITRKLADMFPRNSLLTIFKAFFQPLLECHGII